MSLNIFVYWAFETVQDKPSKISWIFQCQKWCSKVFVVCLLGDSGRNSLLKFEMAGEMWLSYGYWGMVC